MPRIPQSYRKFLANYRVPDGRYEYMTRELSRKFMAPNRKEVARYLTNRYPEIRDIDIGEVYGPYLPSEQALMGGNRFASAYQREVDKRREQLLQEYYDRVPQAERIPTERAFDQFDRKARNELDDYLENRPTRIPIIPEYKFEWTRPDVTRERFYGFTEDDVRDRLRLRGIPDDEGWVKPYPPIPMKYR
jgi:hypothetical protein